MSFLSVESPTSDNTEFQISLSNLIWSSLTGEIEGKEPSTRQWLGLTSVSNKLVVFGGFSNGIVVLVSGFLATNLWPVLASTGSSAQRHVWIRHVRDDVERYQRKINGDSALTTIQTWYGVVKWANLCLRGQLFEWWATTRTRHKECKLKKNWLHLEHLSSSKYSITSA